MNVPATNIRYCAVHAIGKRSIWMNSFSLTRSSKVDQTQRRFFNPYEPSEEFFSGSIVERPKEPPKKKKKKKKPKKEIPPMDPIDVALQKMKMRFEEIEKEHLGPKRGIRTVKWLAGKKCEGIHKTVTTKMANSILNSWVYCRHALQHGHYQLNDMTKLELAESILGKGTKVKVPDRDARIILKELFRTGKSKQLERYVILDQEKRKVMGRQEAATRRNLLGVPKIRNIATREEMVEHGYSEEEISDEMHSRAKREISRLTKKKLREMPAYLRNEISGSRRRDAERIVRLQAKKEKKALRRKLEREARRKALGLSPDDNSDSKSSTEGGNSDSDEEGSDSYDDSDYDSDEESRYNYDDTDDEGNDSEDSDGESTDEENVSSDDASDDDYVSDGDGLNDDDDSDVEPSADYGGGEDEVDGSHLEKDSKHSIVDLNGRWNSSVDCDGTSNKVNGENLVPQHECDKTDSKNDVTRHIDTVIESKSSDQSGIEASTIDEKK